MAWSRQLLKGLRRGSALLAWVLAAGGAPSALAGETLSIAVSRSPLSLPLYVAQEQGYFALEKVELTFIECVGGHRCLRNMLEGRAELATASELPVVFNSFERTDYAIIGTFASTSDDIKLIVATPPGATSRSPLEGKRIGVVAGSASQYFLDLHLLTIGLDPRALTMVALQPEEMSGSITSGQVDAIAIWEPYGYLAVKALGGRGQVVPGAGRYVSTFNLIAQRRLLGHRDVALTGVLRAVERAEQFIQQRPDEAQAILRRRLQVDQAFVDWVWPGLGFRLGLEQSLLSTMESQARWALREGHVKGKTSPNFLFLLHTAPLRAIKPAAVGTGR
jgi:NitT/TauT family transport system substrate-binding protein